VVSASLIERFDYVALGHLHAPQAAEPGSVRYSGSLLKYSFDEADHRKSVTLVDIGPTGLEAVEEVELPIRRDVRRLRGSLEEIIGTGPGPVLSEAYIEVVLTDPEPVPNALERLRQVLPHVLSVRREQTAGALLGPRATSSGVKTRDVAELFGEFFVDVRGTTLDELQMAELTAAIDEAERVRREVAAT
jgi:exonuclease SbcD